MIIIIIIIIIIIYITYFATIVKKVPVRALISEQSLRMKPRGRVNKLRQAYNKPVKSIAASSFFYNEVITLPDTALQIDRVHGPHSFFLNKHRMLL